MSVEGEKPADKLTRQLASRRWRLSHLYYIQDKDGKKVLFSPNWAQLLLLAGLHYLNVILKARQLGITTFFCILYLDTCLFNSDVSAGIIAHTREDAEEIFESKVKYPFDNIPKHIRERIPSKRDSVRKLSFGNGSQIRVGTSMRSGTLQYLHISEFGKICAQYPWKAREIISGALQAVSVGQFVTIESTAEGQEGAFHDICRDAENLQKQGTDLGPTQYKFFFFAWWQEPQYRLENTAGVVITKAIRKYFETLEKEHGIVCDEHQIAWYAEKYRLNGEDVYREYPSTPAEAFKASVEGAYYGPQMEYLRKNKRITRVPYTPGIPVNTGWDIGFGDDMTIWFHQRVGLSNHIINYVEGVGEGLEYYWQEMQKLGYSWGSHYFPHDACNGSPQTGKTFKQYAEDLGMRNVVQVSRIPNANVGVEAMRRFIPTLWIDEENVAKGITCLDNYRKEWDVNAGGFKSTPLHNWASHGEAGLRSLACGYRPGQAYHPDGKKPAGRARSHRTA